MFNATELDRGSSAVHLTQAVFCSDCENISTSPHEVCTVCGSRAVVGLFQMLGGTLRSRHANLPNVTVKYNLQLELRAFDVPSAELNHAIEAITRLLDIGSDVECARMQIDSVISSSNRTTARAA
jgi:hypothetical protein